MLEGTIQKNTDICPCILLFLNANKSNKVNFHSILVSYVVYFVLDDDCNDY